MKYLLKFKDKPYLLIGFFVIAYLFFVLVYKNEAQNPHTGPQTIKIGAVLALSGDASGWGEASKNGITLATEDINARGGINGLPVEVIFEDMHSTSIGSISATQKLLSTDKVKAIIGPSWLDVYQGAAELVKNSNITLMAPDAGIEAINGEKVHRNVFSLWYRTDVKAKTLVQHWVHSGIKNIGIILQNDSYYLDFGARIQKYAEQNGIAVTIAEYVNSGTSDIRTPSTKIKRADPDAILFAFYDEKAMLGFLTQHRNTMAHIPLYGDELLADHYSKPEFRKLSDGAIYFHATTPHSDFVSRYTARFGTKPIFGASTSYDSLIIAANMLQDNGIDVDQNQYLRSHTFETVSFGKIKFDEIGGVATDNNQFDLWKINDGEAEKIPWK